MHSACMATKTISLDLTAYHKLASARREAAESFSSVIKRAEWPHGGTRGSDLLSLLASLPPVPPKVLAALESHQKDDQPPVDKWR
jgi:hypothetical protein